MMVSEMLRELVLKFAEAKYNQGVIDQNYTSERCLENANDAVLVTFKQLMAEISKLEKSEKTLNALEAAGVDNWEGYSEAFNKENDHQGGYCAYCDEPIHIDFEVGDTVCCSPKCVDNYIAER